MKTRRFGRSGLQVSELVLGGGIIERKRGQSHFSAFP